MKVDLASVWGKKKSSQGCVGWRGPQRYTAFGSAFYSRLVPVRLFNCLVKENAPMRSGAICAVGTGSWKLPFSDIDGDASRL